MGLHYEQCRERVFLDLTIHLFTYKLIEFKQNANQFRRKLLRRRNMYSNVGWSISKRYVRDNWKLQKEKKITKNWIFMEERKMDSLNKWHVLLTSEMKTTRRMKKMWKKYFNNKFLLSQIDYDDDKRGIRERKHTKRVPFSFFFLRNESPIKKCLWLSDSMYHIRLYFSPAYTVAIGAET